MRIVLMVWCLALLAPANAYGQGPTESATAPPSKTTYFLIDASGSMEKRQSKLDAALIAKRKELALAGLPPAIETRFGGNNGGLCGTPVEIGRTDAGEFGKDDTQLGTALEAALIAAGDRPADIFLFTDEEQTPGCGPDICTVAERYLPKAGIFVQSIPIDASTYDHNRISCIRSAQHKDEKPPLLSLSVNVSNIERSQSSEVGPPISSNPFAAFFEKWLWLIGLGLITFSAILWGLQSLRIALMRETHTYKLEQLQFAALVDNNEIAARKLRSEIDDINVARNAVETRKADLQAKPKWQRRVRKLKHFFAQIRWHWFGVSGLLILATLIFFPSNLSSEPFDMSRAQSQAWFALDSSFAEAFSLMGIALVFFAGSQYRRRLEAEEKNGLASDKALWADGRLKAKHRKQVTDAYDSAQKDLEELQFTPPSDQGRNARSKTFADKSAAVDFTVAMTEAKRIASGPALDFDKVDDSEIATQTALIRQIVSAAQSGWPNWSQIMKPPEARFIMALVNARSETIQPDFLDLWTRWGKALDRPHSESARSIAHQLAQHILVGLKRSELDRETRD